MKKTENKVQLQQPLPTPPSARPSASGIARARAAADPRYNMKALDRAGVSRGRGSAAQAGITAAQGFASAIADVYDDQLRRQSDNANAMLQLHRGQEEYGQALGGLQAQAVYGDQLAALQRQGVLYGLLGDLMR